MRVYSKNLTDEIEAVPFRKMGHVSKTASKTYLHLHFLLWNYLQSNCKSSSNLEENI